MEESATPASSGVSAFLSAMVAATRVHSWVGQPRLQGQHAADNRLKGHREGEVDAADADDQKDDQRPKSHRTVQIAVQPKAARSPSYTESKTPLIFARPPQGQSR
jgi:hypothetical protein